MKNKNNLFIILLFCITIGLQSCGNDDLVIPNEEEVITTLQYTLTAPDGSIAQFTFRDIDGDGGSAPVVTSDTLLANTIYTGQLTLSNETTTPFTDITAEIEEEREEHQFFYDYSFADMLIAYGDTDANGQPVGLETTMSTGAPGTGTLRIVLRHEPDKSAEGVATGDLTNAGGETDIEVVFEVLVL